MNEYDLQKATHLMLYVCEFVFFYREFNQTKKKCDVSYVVHDDLTQIAIFNLQ